MTNNGHNSMTDQTQEDQFNVRVSIFHKLMLYVVLLVFLAVGISTYFSVKNESKALTEGLAHTSKQLAKNVAFSTKSAFWSLNWLFVEQLLQDSVKCGTHDVIFSKVVKPDGGVYLASDKAYYGDAIESSLLFDRETLVDNYYLPDAKEAGMLLVHPFKIQEENWYVILGLSLQSVRKAAHGLILRNLMLGTLILVLAILGSFALSKSISRPVISLANSADIISHGNLDHRVTVRSKDEVGFLAHSFNRMIDNLKKAMGDRLKADEQLREYSQNLEKMVEERTAELKQTIVDLQNTQSQLLQSEKMASIGQLAAGVAHEINNPVGFVKSNLGTMSEYREDLARLLDQHKLIETTSINEKDGPIRKALENIEKVKEEIDFDFIMEDFPKVIEESIDGMERVTKIVSDLKDFAYVDKTELEHADINEGIKSTLSIVWNELKYKAEVIKDLGDIPLIECYPQRLNQVFMNILVNAAHAIEKKGTIRVSTRADDGHVEIRISDTGKGIPPEVMPKIFDPFFTTKEVGKGTGLGLNMAYNIIEKHKGTIDVESEVGKGTTFIIRLQIEPDIESSQE